MAKYQTRQRRLLTEYLENHKDETVSVSDAAKALGDISLSALYRNFAAICGCTRRDVGRVSVAGEKHGTVGVIFGKEVVEITTYRCDGAYSDSRHPDQVTFVRSLKEDLARRDFTVNAMAYSPSQGLRDPFGGRRIWQRACCGRWAMRRPAFRRTPCGSCGVCALPPNWVCG